MDDTAKAQIESRTAQALEQGSYEDFREAYRERLRWLKEAKPDAFTTAVTYYNDTLLPHIASGQPAIMEWLRYGWRLGELSGAGKLFAIDDSGRAKEVKDVNSENALLLHLPNENNIPALPLAVPKNLSQHQKASIDLLVRRKLSLE